MFYSGWQASQARRGGGRAAVRADRLSGRVGVSPPGAGRPCRMRRVHLTALLAACGGGSPRPAPIAGGPDLECPAAGATAPGPRGARSTPPIDFDGDGLADFA